MKKNSLKWLSLMMAFLLIIPGTIGQAATNVDVTLTKDVSTVQLTDAATREFEVNHGFDVSFNAVTTGLDIALILDRSNSMLYKDLSTGNRVVYGVRNAVIDFINEIYDTYPDSNVAVVSFGSNGAKSDGWYYYDNAADAIDEVEWVYDYYSYWYYGRKYYRWENWYSSEGGTNIRVGFETAEDTVENKRVYGESHDQDVIVFFTDGVATQGGASYQHNYNSPTSHNTNTVAAYEAGQDAQAVAEVITVGYFEGISNSSTKAVARDTLDKAQNAGLFEAAQTSQLSSIFDTIVTELNYVGTQATVTEVIENDFEIVAGSISPGDYELSTDNQGRTVITWSLGNVVEKDYDFTYRVTVKDDVYPTGSGTVKIPVNADPTFSYRDLDGNTVTDTLYNLETTVPTKGDQPVLTVNTVYDNNQYGYLVGDTIHMVHHMNFTNAAPLDYKGISVGNLSKTISGGAFGTAFEIDAVSVGEWTQVGENLERGILEAKTVPAEENLVWTKAVDLTLKPLVAGVYSLGNSVDYTLTNSVGLDFAFANASADPSAVTIKDGQLRLTMMDDYGAYITDQLTVTVDGVEMTGILEGNEVVYTGFNTGTHTINLSLPSGYELSSGNTGVTVTDTGLAFDSNMDFNSPVYSKTLLFDRLNVKGIGVTNRSGGSAAAISQVDEETDAIVTFELVRALTVVKLELDDDYGPSDHSFTLDTVVSGEARVENSAGVQVDGFTMVGDTLTYNGSALPVDSYKAYGVISPPDTLGDDLDYEYEVGVVRISTKEATDPSEITMDVTSSELLISMEDDEAPVIVATYMEAESSTNKANHDITVTDKTIITDVKIFEGEQTLATMSDPDVVEVSFDTLEDTGEYRLLDADIELTATVEVEKIKLSGVVTIYAVDAFGNEGILVVEVENEKINDFIDEDIQ